MNYVIFEIDAKIVTDALHSHKEDMSKFGSIINSCKSVLQDQQTFKVCFSKRQENEVDDALAKATCSYASSSVWYNFPSFFSNLLF